MRNAKVVGMCAVLAVMVLAAGQAQAAIVSLQFSGYGGNEFTASDSAGLEAAINWNVKRAYDLFPGTIALPALHDDSNAATTITGQCSAFGKWTQIGMPASPTANQKLFSSLIGVQDITEGTPPVYKGGPGTVSFANLNGNGFTNYDVIVYFGNDTGGTGAVKSGLFSVNGGTAFTVNTQALVVSNQGSPVTFSDATGTSGNYVRINGLTGDTLSLTFGNLVSGQYNIVGMTGVQIVGVPEPATLTLLGVGGVGMLVGRKRRSK